VREALGILAVVLLLGAIAPWVPAAAAATPNDPSFALQWGDSNTGQTIPTQGVEGSEPLGPPASGTPGADDRALAAWKVSTGSRSIVIGELDTGVESSHPDLAGNIWSNPGGVGGCPAGTHGFDAVSTTCYPEDEDQSYGGHGTHVAGIMGAVGNNGVGVTGLNWQTSVLPVKWAQSAGTETDDLVDALKWLVTAKEQGVNIRVVNDSLTYYGTLYSSEVKSEIEALGAHDILFVTAAGNTANNNDEESVRRYPCGYDLPNELCVTAINDRDELPNWANYGPHTVDLAAPGVSIYSTLREGRYGFLSGGSMASAQVAGGAALILSAEPALTAQQLKADIVGNVRPLRALKGMVISGGTLDICRAMPGCEATRPPAVTTLAASTIASMTATLTATVDPNGGQVSDCHFDYGTTSTYGASAPCTPPPGHGTEPVEVSASLGGLSPDTIYHYRVVASNTGGTGTGTDRTFTTLPEPPGVSAVTASSITQTAATLNASADPNGGEVSSCRFEYGTTSAYGERAQCVPMPGGGTSPVAVSARLGNLIPNTTYHARVVATNGGGRGVGADLVFTTLVVPPSIARESASAVAQTSATLGASVNPNGGNVTACSFEYGPTSSYGNSAPCASLPGSGETPVSVSAAISGLSAGTTYHFRVLARSAGGTGAGADLTFTTLPNAPTVLTGDASEVEGDAATLNALVNPNSALVSDCHFEYGTAAGRGSRVPCLPSVGSGSAPVAVSARVTGLAPHTRYHFHIVATNAGGSSEGRDETFVTTDRPAVLTEAAVEVTQTSGTLRASVNPNGDALSDCHFDYGSSTAYGERVPCTPMPASTASPVEVSAPIRGLTAASTYHFRIVATNSEGTSVGADQTFDTQPIASRSEGPSVAPAPSPQAPGTLSAFGPVAAAPLRTAPRMPPVPSLLSNALTMSSSRVVRVILVCPPGAQSCVGSIGLRVAPNSLWRVAGQRRSRNGDGKQLLAIARGRYAVAPGRAMSVVLVLSLQGRRVLAVGHALRGQVVLRAEAPTGASLVRDLPVTVAARAKRAR
jgi:subtilisin family serine protease